MSFFEGVGLISKSIRNRNTHAADKFTAGGNDEVYTFQFWTKKKAIPRREWLLNG